MAKEPKVGSKSFYRKYAIEMAKLIAKHRDNYTCQKCEKKVSGSDCHGSHVYPVGCYPAIAARVINLKVMCYGCHLQWWHLHPIEAGEWFVQKFPERHEQLLVEKNLQRVDMRDEYERNSKEIKRLGITYPKNKNSKYNYFPDN